MMRTYPGLLARLLGSLAGVALGVAASPMSLTVPSPRSSVLTRPGQLHFGEPDSGEPAWGEPAWGEPGSGEPDSGQPERRGPVHRHFARDSSGRLVRSAGSVTSTKRGHTTRSSSRLHAGGSPTSVPVRLLGSDRAAHPKVQLSRRSPARARHEAPPFPPPAPVGSTDEEIKIPDRMCGIRPASDALMDPFHEHALIVAGYSPDRATELSTVFGLRLHATRVLSSQADVERWTHPELRAAICELERIVRREIGARDYDIVLSLLSQDADSAISCGLR